MFIPKEKIEWKKVRYMKTPWQEPDDVAKWGYELWLNEPLASWDVFSYWERDRVVSMEKNLKKGDILFDIGTEQGWCNLVYAHMVGPENMVLVEPTPEFWPNIKALWEKNFSVPPLACVDKFFSNRSTANHFLGKNRFPEWSDDPIIDRNSYKNLSDPSHTAAVKQIKLDDFVEVSGIVPDALTIDVEGAELAVLQGAEKTLSKHNLKVWVSEHDDLAEQGYGVKYGDVSAFMKKLGYYGEVLGTDHERHVLYQKL